MEEKFSIEDIKEFIKQTTGRDWKGTKIFDDNLRKFRSAKISDFDTEGRVVCKFEKKHVKSNKAIIVSPEKFIFLEGFSYAHDKKNKCLELLASSQVPKKVDKSAEWQKFLGKPVEKEKNI